MATSRKRTVEIDVVVDDKQASQKLKGVGDEAQKSAKGFSGLSTGMKAAAVGAGAFIATNVVGFLGDAVKNALADEAATKQLALAVENATGATEAQVAGVADYIDKTQAATGITDDELRPALANLVRATGDVTEAQELMGTAMDIATARGLPLEQVSLALTKAAQGNVGALGRLGLNVRDTSGEFLTFEEAVAEANETFGGATDEMANSAEGKMKRVQIAFDEAQESLGAKLIPAVTTAIDTFNFFASAAAGPVEHSMEVMSQSFSELVSIGIDPTATAMKSLAAILIEAENNVETTTESLNFLINMLGLEGRSLQEVTRYLKENGTALGLSSAEVDNLVSVLNIADQAARDMGRGLGVARGELKANTEATYENIVATQELVDPLFAAIKAEERLEAATQAYTTELAKNGPHTKKAEELALALAEAQLAGNAAAQRYADEGGDASVAAFIALAREAGLSEAAIRRFIDSVEDANRTPVRTTWPGRPSGGGAQEFHTGGVVQGDYPGQVVPVAARAGEFISQGGTPAHNGNGGPMVVQVNVDGKRFIEELVVPQLARYSRRNGGLGF